MTPIAASPRPIEPATETSGGMENDHDHLDRAGQAHIARSTAARAPRWPRGRHPMRRCPERPFAKSARALMARGITGPSRPARPASPYAFMRGDIKTTAGLTVREPDRGLVHFAV